MQNLNIDTIRKSTNLDLLRLVRKQENKKVLADNLISLLSSNYSKIKEDNLIKAKFLYLVDTFLLVNRNNTDFNSKPEIFFTGNFYKMISSLENQEISAN